MNTGSRENPSPHSNDSRRQQNRAELLSASRLAQNQREMESKRFRQSQTGLGGSKAVFTAPKHFSSVFCCTATLHRPLKLSTGRLFVMS